MKSAALSIALAFTIAALLAPPRSLSLAAQFERPRYFQWADHVPDPDRNQLGGIVFLQQNGRVHSIAWFGRSVARPPWPAVYGMGMIDGNKATIAYRTLSGGPAHEFYHAIATFEFSDAGGRFHCTFLQKADPRDDEPLSPGAADGVLERALTPEARNYMDEIVSLSQPKALPAGTHCPVLTNREALPEVSTEHNGKTYHFCCPSCREVFEKDPERFADR